MCNLLLENEAVIDKCDTRGWTPAMVATKEGNVATLQLLIANGCNLEVQVGQIKWFYCLYLDTK